MIIRKYLFSFFYRVTRFLARIITSLYQFIFNKKQDLTKQFGETFFLNNTKVKVTQAEPQECHGFPTSVKPYNSMYDVRNKLPLFTKSSQSKSLYCAGYYTIQFNKGWVKSFCPNSLLWNVTHTRVRLKLS